MHRCEVLVAGHWRPGAKGTYPVVDPSTGHVVGHAAHADAGDASAAATAAAESFCAWRATSLSARRSVLSRAADRLAAVEADLVELVIAETGATRTVAESVQVRAAIERLRWYAATADDDLDRWLPTGERFTSFRDPVGPVACIAPYNFPLLAMVGKVAPALLAGNPVVMKPAPQDPLAVVVLAEALDDAVRAESGLQGVINLLTGPDPALGEALVAADEIAMVSFTGSTTVGQAIASAAGADMKRLLLELGGKAACIVTDDADLDRAVNALSRTWTVHAGQVCLAPTRAIVHERRSPELLDRLSAVLDGLTIGDPRDRSTDVGPVISGGQRDRIDAIVARGIAAGASRIQRDDDQFPDGGWWSRPTLLHDCAADNPAATEEIFGPVVTVLACTDDDHAVEIANSTPYGLYDYVFSADVERARQLARRLDAAQVAINTHSRPTTAPFGGTKRSGLGRAGGLSAIHAYTEMRTIVE